MTKLKEYVRLHKQVRDARRTLNSAEQKITALNNDYFLSYVCNGRHACINKFKRVIVDAPKTQYVDDTGFVQTCASFSKNSVCVHRKCEMFADNVSFVAARESYNMLRQKRRDLRKQIFGIRVR